MEKKAALCGEQGRDGREDGCTQPITEHGVLTDPAAGKCLYPGISMNFAYSLVGHHDVFPHLTDEAPQGKIWNFITMQIQLGCCSLTSPSPHPSLLCLKITWVCNHTFPYFLLKYLRRNIELVQMGILILLSP